MVVGRAMPDPKDETETTGSWFNWWPSPVITSGSLLVAVVLGSVGLLLFVVGIVLFANALLVPSIPCLVAGVGFGWWAYRRAVPGGSRSA